MFFDKDSLVYKVFCFCIYGSFGGLYPYVALYFKQLGLGAHQSGTIIGTRPLVQCLGAPFWGALSDKFKVGRFILVGGISAWLLKALLILTITPHKQQCISIYRNQSQNAAFVFVDNLWGLADSGSTWATVPSGELEMGSNLTLDYPVVVQKKRLIRLDYKNGGKVRAGNQEKTLRDMSKLQNTRDDEQTWDSLNLHSNTIRHKGVWRNRSIIREVGPKLRYDATVKQSKKISKATEHLESSHKAITATVVRFEPQLGTKVKYITQIDKQEVYHIFIIFTLIIIIGEFLESPTFALSDASMVSYLREKKEDYGKLRMFGSVGATVSVLLVGCLAFNSRFDLCRVVQHNYIVAFYVYSGFVSAALFTVFGFTFRYPDKNSQGPTIKEAASLLFNIADMSFLMAAWFAGICYGFLVHYVNWYIDDLQGNSVIMGAAGASRELAGIVFFFLEGSIIRQFGHVLAMACGLFIYSTSLCLYSLLSYPLMAVILEAFNGATYALVWSILLNYFNTAGKQLQSPAVLQGKAGA